MSLDIRHLVPQPCDLLALGEPTHQEPAFGAVRNELFAQLVAIGFRSIALETDRVAALGVDDFVRDGSGSPDGFSHNFGDLRANQELVAWMRDHNRGRPAGERLTFHGFDAPTENTSAPSPRSYLAYARDYLGLADLDLGGDDERWSRQEAILDHAQSMGATPEAERLRTIGEDLLTRLYARAAELVAATSRASWHRARIHAEAGLSLLNYHWQASRPLPQNERIALLMATRDTMMARNLADIRRAEADRGPTLVFAHNLHLQRSGPWAGAIADAVGIGRYFFIASSLGRSATLGLGEPDPATWEGGLQQRVTGWGLLRASEVTPGRTRTDTEPRQGYFPLDRSLVDSADAILHVSG